MGKESPYRGAGVLVKEFPQLWILPIYLNTTPNIGLWNFIFGRNEMSVCIGSPFQAEPALIERDAREITKQLVDKIIALPDMERTTKIHKRSINVESY